MAPAADQTADERSDGASEETLRRLLASQSESPELDFKSRLDLGETRHVLALAKGIAAMSNHGGHIVVGTDERGQPTGGVTPKDVSLFDESRVRGKVGKYLPPGTSFHTACHDIDGHTVAVVSVGRHPAGFCIMSADGNYEGGSEFRAGDIFVRRGTSTVRAGQDDVRGLMHALREEVRESVRREVREEWQAAASAVAPSVESRLPSLKWALDLDGFAETVADHLARDSDVALRQLLVDVPKRVAALRRGERGIERTAEVVDRCGIVLAQALVSGSDDLFRLVLRRLAQVYEASVQDQSPVTAVPSAVMGMLLVERLHAIGGFAVRERRFDLVRDLVLQPIRVARRASPHWLKDMQRRAEGANLYSVVEGGRTRYVWVLSRGQEAIGRNPHLAPDALPDDECVMTSLCEFDLLAGLVAIDAAGSTEPAVLHGNFAGWYAERTDPIVVELLDAYSDVRKVVFPGTDAELATALRTLCDYAMGSGPLLGPPWDGFEDRRILNFLAEHAI